MSEFSRFLKKNKIAQKNEKYAPTKSLTDENGKPLEFEFRHISSKENDSLQDSCTIDVPVKGKPNMTKPKLDSSQYIAKLIAESVVYPDLYNTELQDSYGVKTPVGLLYEMVDNPGEYQDLCVWVQKFQGFNTGIDDKVEEAKN